MCGCTREYGRRKISYYVERQEEPPPCQPIQRKPTTPVCSSLVRPATTASVPPSQPAIPVIRPPVSRCIFPNLSLFPFPSSFLVLFFHRITPKTTKHQQKSDFSLTHACRKTYLPSHPFLSIVYFSPLSKPLKSVIMAGNNEAPYDPYIPSGQAAPAQGAGATRTQQLQAVGLLPHFPLPRLSSSLPSLRVWSGAPVGGRCPVGM